MEESKYTFSSLVPMASWELPPQTQIAKAQEKYSTQFSVWWEEISDFHDKEDIHLAGLCFAIAVKIRKLEQPRKRLQPCSCTHMCKYTTKYAEPLLLLLSWHKTGTLAESFKHKPASCVNNIWLLLVAKCNWQLFTVCITTAVTDIPEPQC